MNYPIRPFVQMAIDAVDVVLSDPEGQYDPDHFDRYETFGEARGAALTSLEVMLDERDYDDEDHRQEIEQVLEMLESARSYEDLEARPEYCRYLGILNPSRSAA
jgi:hypothetical protein